MFQDKSSQIIEFSNKLFSYYYIVGGSKLGGLGGGNSLLDRIVNLMSVVLCLGLALADCFLITVLARSILIVTTVNIQGIYLCNCKDLLQFYRDCKMELFRQVTDVQITLASFYFLLHTDNSASWYYVAFCVISSCTYAVHAIFDATKVPVVDNLNTVLPPTVVAALTCFNLRFLSFQSYCFIARLSLLKMTLRIVPHSLFLMLSPQILIVFLIFDLVLEEVSTETRSAYSRTTRQPNVYIF